MSAQLPSDWTVAHLGELSTAIQYGYTDKAQQEKVGPRFLRITDIQDDKVNWDTVPFCVIDEHEKEKYLLRRGDLVFARTGATVGKSFLISGSIPDSVFASYLIRVRLRPDIEPKYVSYFFRSTDYWRQISESQAGIGQPNVNGKKLAQIQIPVAPLDQQKRIVAEIEKQFSRLDEAVANLKRVKANLKRYKAAVLKVAVEGRLVETEADLACREGRSFETGEQLLQRILETRRSQWQGKGKYKEPAAADTTDLPELPEGWVWATVEQLADVQLGKMLDRQKHQSGKELPYLRNINVRWDSVDSSDLLTMFFKDSELERYGLQTGDVLVCEGGEPGRAAIWDGRILGMMYQKAIHRVRFRAGYEQRLLVFYLEFLAKTGRLERWFTGSTIKHFTRESFAQLPIPVAPESEQRRIVMEVDRRFSLLRETEAQVDANLLRAGRLRQSILSRAFSGTLQ